MKLTATTATQSNIDWTSTQDSVFAKLIQSGYTLFQNDSTSEYKFVMYANGEPQESEQDGYTFVREVQPNAGFSDIGATLDWVNGDEDLQDIADTYSIPNPATFEELAVLDLSTIPEIDFRYTISTSGIIIYDLAILKQ